MLLEPGTRLGPFEIVSLLGTGGMGEVYRARDTRLEQVEGGVVDARTDIFAFGIVLYEMLAGRRPFASDSRVSLMAAIVSQDPPALSELAPLTSPSLQRLVARCLAKNPDDRWQTARDLAAELRWIAEGSSATDTKSPPVATGRPRRPFWLGALIGGTLVAIAIAAAASLMWPGATTAAHDPVTFRRGSVSSARFTPDGQNVVYQRELGGPYNMFLGHQRARSLELAGGRIMSVSRSGEMAAVFGPPNAKLVRARPGMGLRLFVTRGLR